MERTRGSSGNGSENKGKNVEQQSRKQHKTNVIDYINDIPEAIVFHILSLLPLRELIIMSLVSKKWNHIIVRYLSVIPSNLNLNELEMTRTILRRDLQCSVCGNLTSACNSLQHMYQLIHAARKKFIEFVDRTFQLHSGCTINNLQLSFPYEAGDEYEYTRKIDRWVHIAFTNDIKELSLNFSTGKISEPSELAQPCELPHGCFAPKILETLNLNFCKFSPSSFQVFGSLQKISLLQVKVFDCSLAELVSKCPVLEDVNLESCVFPDEFMMSEEDIMIKTLSVINCETHEWPMYHIDLSTPCLQKLTIIGNYLMSSHIRNAIELLDVLIGIKDIHANHVQGDALALLLIGFNHCRSLTLNTWCIQVLPTGNNLLERLPTSLHKLKHLRLVVCLAKCELPGISCLLRSSPNIANLTLRILESENVDWEEFQEGIPEIFDFEEQIYWDTQNSTFACLEKSLRKITIDGFSGSMNEMKMIQFLLKKARVLQKMEVISIPANSIFQNGPQQQMQYMWFQHQIFEMLFNFPRASSQASIAIS